MPEFVAIVPQRRLGEIVAQVTIEEEATDTLTITSHPVERGASITDHAFKEPAALSLRLGWSDANPAAADDPDFLRATYEALLALQVSAIPFAIETGKRSYSNMLIASISQTTDQATERALFVNVACREILIAETSTATVPPARESQAQPDKTQATTDTGTKQALPAKNANVSKLQQVVNAVGGGQ